ncbi:MAG: hypothetical protein LBE22_02125, partial [Azoarcus sp.]|nr:hypothetical protein [Azoarcus sp.]
FVWKLSDKPNLNYPDYPKEVQSAVISVDEYREVVAEFVRVIEDCQKIPVSTLEIRGKRKSPYYWVYDFYIDGKYLPGILNIGLRDENRGYSHFDLDYRNYEDIDFEHYTEYNSAEDIRKVAAARRKRDISAFLAQEYPETPFGSKRVILYGCHCGCEHCGVISFCLTMDEEYVYWADIGPEDVESKFDYAGYIGDIYQKISTLKFRKDEYEQAFAKYCEEIDALCSEKE